MLTFYLSLIDEEEQKEKFTVLYEMYAGLMLGIAFKYLGDRQLAEDAVHNAFISIAKNMDKVGDAESKKTRSLLLTVTRTAAIKLYNKNSREIPDGEIKTRGNTGFSPSAESEYFEYADSNELKEAVKNLPDAYREPLLLRVVYGYSYKHIAKLLGISEPNCRKRVERAKKYLGMN